MARLIDANLLLKDKTILWDEALGFCGCVLVEDIDNAPTIDAVPVVRCKDCEYGMYAGLGKFMCEIHEFVGKAYFYCADGVRKTDE